ncbi:hypothetical protein KM043_004625 [Ampulex compressa]|nr:hypothetical protein KM043_004625 [Ampulex compressa]
MSLCRCNHPSHVGIPWKTFIRESCNIIEESPENYTYRLAFQGEEARTTYEEIISEKGNTNSKTDKHKCLVQKNEIRKNIQTRKTCSEGETLPKITINLILKAIEQKDLKFLLKHVTLENVNSTDDFGWTPLMLAAYCGHLDIVQFLLNVGANKRTKEKSGLTAAQLALKKNYLSIVALLKKKTESLNNTNHSIAAVTKNTEDMSSRLDTKEPLKNSNAVVHTNVEQTQERLPCATGFYCEICKTTFRHATLKQHESSTLHIFNTKPKLSAAMYGISRQNKGYQMLLNTGWDEESGLGPSGKGMKYPVKTCLKIDRKGLGQPTGTEPRVTHCLLTESNEISNFKIIKQRCLKKKDREKLLNREARKERAIRIALS